MVAEEGDKLTVHGLEEAGATSISAVAVQVLPAPLTSTVTPESKLVDPVLQLLQAVATLLEPLPVRVAILALSFVQVDVGFVPIPEVDKFKVTVPPIFSTVAFGATEQLTGSSASHILPFQVVPLLQYH
jgi:hypothetical protein